MNHQSHWVLLLLSILVATGLLLGWGLSPVTAAPAPPIYWHTAGTGLPADVQILVAAPLSPTVLYAGAWGDGVYRSVDHGATWLTATAGLTLPMYISGDYPQVNS